MTSAVVERPRTARADQSACAAIVRAHAKTFSLAAGLLPPAKRRGVFALYAFCRVADDIVDDASSTDAARALDAHRARLQRALNGQGDDAVFRELAWTIAHFGVPAAPLEELVDGVARDLDPPRIADDDALRAYCEGVAGSVGEMCTPVFGVVGDGAARERAVSNARTLGVAMQLTNILRDVGEDARRGRCYLPDNALAAAGLTRDDVLHSPGVASAPGWPAMMRALIAQARAWYAEAEDGIALLEPDARSCAAACARGYALILDAIEAQGFDTMRTRAVVSRWRKAGVLLDALGR